ncbi:MAG TPA: glycosyltransferase family 4 protein [Sphingomonas sp.]
MNILFVHQNMPGQFKHLAPHMAAQGHRVVFLTQRKGVVIPGVETVTYAVPRQAGAQTHQYVRLFENSVIAGQEVVRQVQGLRRKGFRPDMIVAHSGWGEALFLKDACPRVPLLTYSEFYYRDTELHFEPGREVSLDQVCRLRARNANLLLSLEACDAALAPTRWQKSVQPPAFHDKISVIFDGIDTRLVAPDATARFALEDGTVLTRTDEVVTYVARNLEPYRGFPSFMRSLPRLLAERPQARVVIVGGDGVSYGSAPPGGGTWRETMLTEVPVDPTRVHFIPRLAYNRYLELLQISAAHVYLTYPFVLSWSFMEAMASGCLVIGSATEPVEEVIHHGVNGLLADFHNPDDIARTVIDALAAGDATEPLRRRARAVVEARYDLAGALAKQGALVTRLVG